MSRTCARPRGFTIIELLVVLAAIGLLLSIAAPRYVQHLDHTRDLALKHDLQAMRLAIDQFRADQGRYPGALGELVARRYLRALPVDPVTGRADTWVQVQAPVQGPANAALPAGGGIQDVRSGAAGVASDGSRYASW